MGTDAPVLLSMQQSLVSGCFLILAGAIEGCFCNGELQHLPVWGWTFVSNHSNLWILPSGWQYVCEMAAMPCQVVSMHLAAYQWELNLGHISNTSPSSA